MKGNIALIGFMGTGKTAVGKLLAGRLGKEFIELDALIEKKARKTIPEIFARDGEVAFRELEIEATKDVAERENAVMACGGGVVLNQINIDRLRKHSVIVYLTASLEAILERTASDRDERPLLVAEDKSSKVEKLLQFRKPFYERAADITVDTSGLEVTEVVEQIIIRLGENESYR
ncbi:MAG TPA: shikimate kinase [Dehalococcoidia bacterium]|nr:shikimate kinase [Dehalococcoidia bacterium]